MNYIDHVDCIVAGAGAVGIAIARSLAQSGREVLLLDAEPSFGSHISSRNSEVIHGGIYYPPGSAKAVHCIDGKERLYSYARKNEVPYRNCGKLVVAAGADQEQKLSAIFENAKDCGVHDLQMLDGHEAGRLEPALSASAALLSRSTGIFDSHVFMQSMLADVENAGSQIAFRTRVERGRRQGDSLILKTHQTPGEQSFEISTALFVNSTGLAAQGVAASIEGFPESRIPALRLAKGNYFSANGHSPFSRLIYPVPAAGGLGVHLTFDLCGQMRFGPDVEWIDTINYKVDPQRSQSFYAEIRRYWPGLPDNSLMPSYSGIRPKISGPGEPAADFVIEGPEQHGVPGIINLFGIESPGLTASLSIAERVREMAS